jgi:hypothetical protein
LHILDKRKRKHVLCIYPCFISSLTSQKIHSCFNASLLKLDEVIYLSKSLKLNLVTRISYLCSKSGWSLSLFEIFKGKMLKMFATCFHKCINCHEHHTYYTTKCTSHSVWYRHVLINLIMCNWHFRPKYVFFLSMHIFRGSNLCCIELW